MTSYDGIGISLYMILVHDRHMSVYDEDSESALILVMATDFLGTRPLISASGICLIILPNLVPRCFRDWYMLALSCSSCSALFPAAPGWPA
jgi:hypothetical protein